MRKNDLKKLQILKNGRIAYDGQMLLKLLQMKIALKFSFLFIQLI